MARVYTRNAIDRDYNGLVLLFMSLIMLAYVSADTELLVYVKKTVAIPLSIGIMLYARYVQVESLKRALNIAVVIYLVFALLQYADIDTYIVIVRLFVVVSDIYIGERGAASLAPEATDFGFTLAYLLLIALIIHGLEKVKKPKRKLGKYIIPLIFLGIVLSKSASGIMAALIVLVVVNVQLSGIRKIVMGLGVMALLGGILLLLPQDLVENVRGLRLLFMIFSEPQQLLQTSFAHRVAHNLVGIIAFADSYGLGYGAGSFTTIAPDIYLKYGLDEVLSLSDWHVTAVLESLRTAALSVISQLITEYGFLGASFIFVVFWRILYSKMHYKYAVFALMILTWLQSFPIAYPMFWLLAGLARNPKFVQRKKRPTADKYMFDVDDSTTKAVE